MDLFEILVGLAGIALVLIVIIDVLITTLRLTGPGILSVPLANRLWYLLLRNRWLARNHYALSVFGFAIVLFSVLLWLGLLWLGWVLIFMSSETAVINAQTSLPADVWSRIYFVGYSLVTLGLGDYRPEGAVWKIATVLTAANGFFFITLIAAYLLPLISAVSAKRQFAAYITSLGHTPIEIVSSAWNGQNFGALDQHLDSLGPMFTSLAQQHLAYPIIHCMHDQSRPSASAPAIAALGETLLLLRYGVAAEHRPDAITLRVLEGALSNFLETLDAAFIEPDPQPPPLPNLEALRRHGIPTVDTADFQAIATELRKRRCLLLAQVKRDGWRWDNVVGQESDHLRPLEAGS
jgi:hypothetical protein